MDPTLPFQINAWLNRGPNFNLLPAIVLVRCGFFMTAAHVRVAGSQLGLGRSIQLSLTLLLAGY